MPETILVVEYEPRYVDRVKQALTGLPVLAHFAKDGDEAVRLLDTERPKLIVLSSVIPRSSPADLIRNIRARAAFQSTPIVMTISGYTGKSPKADALRFGVNDIVPKPYTDIEFRAKIQEVLNLADTPGAEHAATVKMTSAEIFGDMVDEKAQPQAPPQPQAQPAKQPKPAGGGDVDKMLADTLSGLRVPQPKKPAAAPAAPAADDAQKKAAAAKDLDKLLHDTLSGLEKGGKPKAAEAPAAEPPKPAAPPAPKPQPVEPPKAAAPAAPVAPKPAAPPAPAPAPAAKAAEPPKPVEPPKVVETPKPVEPPKVAEPARPAAPSVPPPAPTRPAAAQSADDKVHLATPVLAPKAETREDEVSTDPNRFGQYSLVEKIATGGMAEVWKAQMRGVEGFQKTVAIKKILPHLSDNEEFVTMFVDEAKLAAQLNHNNIIHIYDLGRIANSYYIAMEYIEGHDLKTILRRGEDCGQPMPMELALFIASKIAAALDYAHRKRDFNEVEMGLVHRDVSPQNVLISMEGDIKLCDFGIAKAASKASHTQAGALKGKIQYMSPEQASGRPIDRRSDIFALAAVLFEMLAGRKLFTGDSEVSILDQVREANVVAPSEINDEVTPEIDAVVLKALQKDPGKRYQTAGDMARDLDAILYSIRPTPTSADLAIYMHRVENAEPLAQPEEEAPAPEPPPPAPAPAPVAAAPAPPVHAPVHAPAPVPHHEVRADTHPGHAVHPAHEIPAEVEAKKSRIVPIAAGIAVLAILGAAGAYFAMRGKSEPAPATTQVQQASTMTAPTATAPVATTATDTAIPATTTAATATTSTAPPTLGATEQAMIDEEVRKRLAAERTKLDQQRAQQEAAQQQAAVQETPAPVQQPAPAPAQPVQAPPPVVLAPQLTPQAAPARSTREGDFVEPGTPGLVPPELVRLKKPPYPPAAKMRKIEGLVVVNALISETGKVLEVKVLRGVAQNVGINEAAEQAVRESTFTPATKDGVRVKSYKTVTIPFKL